MVLAESELAELAHWDGLTIQLRASALTQEASESSGDSTHTYAATDASSTSALVVALKASCLHQSRRRLEQQVGNHGGCRSN
jgi:hypothetical protein